MMQSLLALMDVLYVDHLAVTTPAFDQTLADYLGLPGSRLLRGPAQNPVQQVSYAFVWLQDGMTVEVLGLVEGSPIERHVTQGGGPYHFCYAVSDIEASIAKAQSAGAKLLTSPVENVAFDGRRVAFLFHEAQGLFELVESYPSQKSSHAMACNNTKAGGAVNPSISMPQTNVSIAGVDERLRNVFSKVFSFSEGNDIAAATINGTPGWDSLTHIRLVMEIEAEFGIDILPSDIGELSSYRSMLDFLERRV